LNNPPGTLAAVLTQCWSLFQEGVDDRHSAMHTGVVGSVSEQGCELRTVVLRHVEPERRILSFHTDSRSPKVTEILRHERVQWVFYHPKAKVQLRVSTMAKVHESDVHSDEAWHLLSPWTRRGYQILQTPGTPSPIATSGLAKWTANQSPDIPNTRSGRENFALVECRIDLLDWLHLGVGRNTRAQFDWRGTELEATWCTP